MRACGAGILVLDRAGQEPCVSSVSVLTSSKVMADAVDAYLHLTESDARAQWRSIKQRTPAPRQVAFLPVETLLCYGLFYRMDPHRYGGGNIDRVPDAAKVLATTSDGRLAPSPTRC